MKFEKLFESKDNKLFTVKGEEKAVTAAMIKSVKWNDVEGDEEVYDEQYLAKLRDELKAVEEKGEFVFIEPVYDKKGAIPGQFINAMKHTARRVKDCASVIGFAIPAEIADDADVVQVYVEKISEKHPQYVYFAKKAINDSVVVY